MTWAPTNAGPNGSRTGSMPRWLSTPRRRKPNYRGRVARLAAACTLERPDRVPVVPQCGFLAHPVGGDDAVPANDRFVRAGQAWLDFARGSNRIPPPSPRAYLCPPRCSRSWTTDCSPGPGTGCARRPAFNTTRRNGCRPDDYDQLIDDPTGYLLRTYLPRTVGAFAGFLEAAQLPRPDRPRNVPATWLDGPRTR